MSTDTKELEEKLKRENFLKILTSLEELENWIDVYLDIKIPFTNVSGSTIDATSDTIHASPGQAIWEAYKTYSEDLYRENPGYIWMANRDGGKTISGSILNILLVCHFKAEIAHLAAVRKQAEKCIEYTNVFLKKVRPYLEFHRRKIVGDSKTKIQIENEDGSVSYIDVVVANLAGGNSQRSTVGSYDELDTLSKQGILGYRESLLIPTRKNKRGPLRIKYSTRKFSGGFFEKEIETREKRGEKLVQWNLLDITEKCKDDRSLKNLGEKHFRYVKKKLPLKIYTQEEVDEMKAEEQSKMRGVYLHKGCLTCPIASVCQGKLSDRSPKEKEGPGSMFKSVDFAIGQFRNVSEEMAEAQLLNWAPSSEGLVYPRFSQGLGDNVLTIDQAFTLLSGEHSSGVTLESLVNYLHSIEAKFYAGVDFGFTNHSVIVVIAETSTGQCIVVDCFSKPGLEAHEFAEIAEGYGEKYKISKWYCDQAAPATIKTFKKKGLKCPEFKKDVQAGIDAVRSRIVTTTGARLLRVLKTEENAPVLTMFKEHHFQLNTAGELTKDPDDTAGIADVGDALRYLGQNVFPAKAAKPKMGETPDPLEAYNKILSKDPSAVAIANELNQQIMKDKIQSLAVEPGPAQDISNKKSKIFWNTD